jgi:DNA repair protein RecO (recombination protein O)
MAQHPDRPSRSTPGQRVDQVEAYVLHTLPFRETSLLVDAFTAEHGRVSLAARGARRPASALRGVLLPFQRVSLSWFGKGEVKTLHGAEWLSITPGLGGRALICGFYLNELLTRLLPREDPHPALYAAYEAALAALPGAARVDAVLRTFELALLADLGYGLDLAHEAGGGAPVVTEGVYRYLPEHGLVRVPDGAGRRDMARRGERSDEAGMSATAGTTVSGVTLLAMEAGDYDDAMTRREALRLLRAALGHYLGDRPLLSREMLAPFQE